MQRFTKHRFLEISKKAGLTRALAILWADIHPGFIQVQAML
jgi:hypothetical protein